jgi:hypothetical protein
MDPAVQDIEAGRARFVRAFDIYIEASRGIGPFLDEGFRKLQECVVPFTLAHHSLFIPYGSLLLITTVGIYVPW